MHPVSISDRSMTCARLTFRALLVMGGILSTSVSPGCLRSTMLRPGDGPVPPSSPSNQPTAGRGSDAPAGPSPPQGGDLSVNPVAAPMANPAETRSAGATPPPPIEPPAATLQQIQSASESVGREQDPVTPAITEPVSETPAPNTTPLLDAAIERVAAVTRPDESVDLNTPAFRSDNEGSRPGAPCPPTGAPIAPPLKLSAAPPPADSPASNPAIGPSLVKHDDPPAAINVSEVPKAETPAVRVENGPKSDTIAPNSSASSSTKTPASSDERAHSPIDVTKPEPVSVEPDPLGIHKLTLCRKVLGFGAFESLADSRVKAGHRLLVDFELTGMQYEEKHSAFVSRLSSRIEIASIANGVIVWVHELGPAEDVCGSRRRDFYVN